MKLSSKISLVGLGVCAALGMGCNKSSGGGGGGAAASFSTEKPSGIMTSISTAVQATGGSMGDASTASVQNDQLKPMFDTSLCDDHGQPKSPINQSHNNYPGVLTFCKLHVNDGSPDTIRGGFEIVKNVSCAVEKAGITFNGQAQTKTIAVDSTCFTAAQIADIGVSSLQVSVTGSKPASFNSYFDAGLVLDITGFGTFSIGTKIAGTTIEFASFENQGSTKTGSTYGSFDQSTGVLRYESRMDRLGCLETGSCGWNRHIKMHADLTMSGSTPVDLESISFGYSNISLQSGNYSGELVTASGNLTAGIKARSWQGTNGSGGAPASMTDLQTISKWSEVANTACYTNVSGTATTCGAGISGMSSSTAFIMTGSYTLPMNWFNGFSGATFTTVDVNAD